MKRLKQAFWIGLYTNCWILINAINKVAELAANHIQKANYPDDGYNEGRYTWKER